MEDNDEQHGTSIREKPLPKRKTTSNPLQAGIVKFCATMTRSGPPELHTLPKRYTRYGSLLLLGPTFPTSSPAWTTFYDSLTQTNRIDLFQHIIRAFNDPLLTHVAINAPIAPQKTSSTGEQNNLIRSPTGLQPVYGDFGPGSGECDDQNPSHRDLVSAYWTQTIQLKNVVQVWAPRWTMFSRGNISEKARILQEDTSGRPFPGLSENELGEAIKNIDVVDFFVGIGYFAFCYLTRGVARVWGWDINGWSVEGLRRGCIANGWNVRLLKINEHGDIADGNSLQNLVHEILALHNTTNAIRCIVFQGDNRWASRILDEVQTLLKVSGKGYELNIRHCNLGLLPSSENSWDDAVRVLDSSKGGWLHIHENVEYNGITMKQQAIAQQLERIAHRIGRSTCSAVPCYVEQVKTYAPGVVHCVYDIKLYPAK